MCGLKVAQIHGRPFRAAKEPVQSLAVVDSFLPYSKRSDILAMYLPWFLSGLIHGDKAWFP